MHEFLALVTHSKLLPGPVPVQQALAAVDAGMQSPTLAMLSESAGHWAVLQGLVGPGKVQGGMVHDSLIAAPCLRHGVSERWTADRDFGRSPSLKVVNLLV